uniref:Protochlorophyllide reductase n=2 Tax=Paramoeba aestuarina TaxID=180227 RepID=A0A7S4NHT0_9EUKA|mmetsp:Transcript_16710/g.26002  ORF Transcript_16710/g.26002 Transcript_16710/m.26002 type:complete len:163 (+) Transcript_16710:246-734(+)
MREGGRIVLVSSAMAREAVSFLADPLLLDKEMYFSPRGGKLYGTSKLMNILHCQGFAKRAKRDITCASVHPGIIKTNLHREENDQSGWVREYILPLVWGLIGISPEQGAKSSLMLATTAHPSGRYYHGASPQDPPNELCEDLELENFLWDKSVELTKSDLQQ